MVEAAEATGRLSALFFGSDGVSFDVAKSHRQASLGCFDVDVLHTPAQVLSPVAADGYSVALRLLAQGKRTLIFAALLPTT